MNNEKSKLHLTETLRVHSDPLPIRLVAIHL